MAGESVDCRAHFFFCHHKHNVKETSGLLLQQDRNISQSPSLACVNQDGQARVLGACCPFQDTSILDCRPCIDWQILTDTVHLVTWTARFLSSHSCIPCECWPWWQGPLGNRIFFISLSGCKESTYGFCISFTKISCSSPHLNRPEINTRAFPTSTCVSCYPDKKSLVWYLRSPASFSFPLCSWPSPSSLVPREHAWSSHTSVTSLHDGHCFLNEVSDPHLSTFSQWVPFSCVDPHSSSL